MSTHEIIRAKPGGCEYLHRNASGKLQECGAPATHKLNKSGGLIYCATCASFVQQSLNRSRSKLDVRALRPEELKERKL